MRNALAPAIALALFALPAAASACSYIQRPEPVGHASGEYFAKEMLRQATHADLVMVESQGAASDVREGAPVVTLRTLARFKGASPDRFTVFGQTATFGAEAERAFGASLLHFVSETGQVTPFPFAEEWVARLLPARRTDPPPPPLAVTSCSPPAITAQMGRFYVVLRDEEGRVMNRVSLSDGRETASNHPAFGFVPVTLTDEDFWLYSIRLAAHGADASGAAPRLLHLRPSVSPDEVESALRKAGARLRAAYFDRAGFIEEVRPSPEEQARPWLAQALPFIAAGDTQRSTLAAHGAAEFLQPALSPVARYRSSLSHEIAQAFVASIRRHGEGKQEPRLVAIEVAGDADRHAGLPFVERVGPLDVSPDLLPQVAGNDEAAQFAAMQRIVRDIWLLNGGDGNRQGTLP